MKSKPRGLLVPVHRALIQVETSLACPPSSLPLLAAEEFSQGRAGVEGVGGGQVMYQLGGTWQGSQLGFPFSRCQPRSDPLSQLASSVALLKIPAGTPVWGN